MIKYLLLPIKMRHSLLVRTLFTTGRQECIIQHPKQREIFYCKLAITVRYALLKRCVENSQHWNHCKSIMSKYIEKCFARSVSSLSLYLCMSKYYMILRMYNGIPRKLIPHVTFALLRTFMIKTSLTDITYKIIISVTFVKSKAKREQRIEANFQICQNMRYTGTF